MSIRTQNISHDHVREVVESHRKNLDLIKVVETTYLDEPTIENDTLSVTYPFDGMTELPPIVFGYGVVIPTPSQPDLIEMYRRHAEICNVHETMIVTSDVVYIATYHKDN